MKVALMNNCSALCIDTYVENVDHAWIINVNNHEVSRDNVSKQNILYGGKRYLLHRRVYPCALTSCALLYCVLK